VLASSQLDCILSDFSVLPPEFWAAISQGLSLLGFVASLGGAVFSTFGISLIPGIGCPVVISSTIWAKEVGYGASGLPGVGVPMAESVSFSSRDGEGALAGKFSLLTRGFVVSTEGRPRIEAESFR
jgi:hypothetical protein